MDLLYLLKENFKDLLSDLLIAGRSFENLSYLSSCSLSQRWKFWRIRSNVFRGIESEQYWGSPLNTFYGLEAYGTQ